MSTEATDAVFKPKVLIVGAGIGGLSLAAILERADIPYEIYEKATALKPLGSAICIGPGVMPMFSQLGVMDQIEAKSKANKETFIFNDSMKKLTHLDYSTGMVERYGWPTLIIARPAIHSILLGLVPPEKIHLNQRVVSHVETEDGISITTSDDKTHHGNILIGADGAYSGVRKFLHEQLANAGKLLPVDQMPLQYSSVCLVGQTRPLDEATYAHIEDKYCRLEFVVGVKKPIFCPSFTTAEKTVCWMVIEMLEKETNRADDKASEWGPNAAEAMCKEVSDFRIRPNMTMGDLIDLTPKEVICKVMLEEKIFETWSSGRTALLGDACHKMTPTAGLGAQAAMFDAVILSNHLSTIKTNSVAEIDNVLRAYRDERYHHSKNAVATSAASKAITKQTFVGFLIRTFFNYIPRWLLHIIGDRTSNYRPQISFLPPAEDKGTHRRDHQPSLEMTRPKKASVAV